MKPFDYEGTIKEEEYFNFELSSSRMVVECLPFRIVEKICKVLAACCSIQVINYISS